MSWWHRQTTDNARGGRGERRGVNAGKAECEGRNSKRKERVKRTKTNDFNIKKKDTVIKSNYTQICMCPTITRFWLDSVHRTTYKSISSSLLIEKCITQFDQKTPYKNLSTLCIPPTFEYQFLMKLSLIKNLRSLNIFVLKFLPILTSRHWGRLSNI